MGTYNLRRLSNPEILRAIDSHYLEELLAPHQAYLAQRGVTLPLAGREEPLKYSALAHLFVAPDRKMPRELLDAIYFIDELATPSGLEALEPAAKAKGIRPAQYLVVTPAELVLQIWLRDPKLVERVHAELAVRRFRTFDYFQPAIEDVRELPPALGKRAKDLEAEMNECFHAKRRGRYARILLDEQEESVWWYIAHWGLLRREGTVEESGPSSICYRPEVYDVVAYIRASGELGVHARASWEKGFYQRLFGKHLFDDEEFFTGKPKYTLEPPKRHGRGALECSDVPGLERVVLTSLRTFQPSRSPRCESFSGVDLFASWGSHALPLCPNAHLLSAGFRLRILGSKTWSRIAIQMPNRAQYTRDLDRGWVDQWLLRRGFILEKGGGDDETVATILAVA